MQLLHWISLGCAGGWRVLLQSCKSNPTRRRQNKHKRGPENNYTLSPEQKAFNNHLSKLRVVVEDTISCMKKFSVIRGIYRHYSVNKARSSLPLDLVVHVIGLLTNFHLGKSPIQGRNWRVDRRTITERWHGLQIFVIDL